MLPSRLTLAMPAAATLHQFNQRRVLRLRPRSFGEFEIALQCPAVPSAVLCVGRKLRASTRFRTGRRKLRWATMRG